MNPWSKDNYYLGINELIEELLQVIKDQYIPGNSDSLDNYIRYTISYYFINFIVIKDNIHNPLDL